MRDALDDLPDLLRNALSHVAVVISDGGRRQRRLRALPGRRCHPRQHPRPHRDLPRHAAPRLRPRPRPAARPGHAHGAPRARPPRRLRRARRQPPRPLICDVRARIARRRRGAIAHFASATLLSLRHERQLGVMARSPPRRRRGTSDQGESPQMPEAVIVDAIRTPIGRAVKGSLKSVRADDLAAIPLKALIERNPQLDSDVDRRRDDGLRLRRGRVGLQRRPHRVAARGHRPPRAGVHGQPLLCLLAADDADGLPRDQGRRGRHLHRRGRRGGRAASGAAAVRVQPQGRRLGGLALQRLHPDGHDRRERGRALQGQPRGPGRMGGHLPDRAVAAVQESGTSTRRSSP